MQCNLQTVNSLDVAFDLDKSEYKSLRKENDKPVYLKKRPITHQLFLVSYQNIFRSKYLKRHLTRIYKPTMNKVKEKKSGKKYGSSHSFPKEENQPIYLLKVKNRNTRTRCEICSKLTIKTPERRQWSRFGVFIVNFEHISHLVLVFLLLTLNM